ncbi:Outer membrane protein (porin) [Cupriavidus basilensis]|uniref:Outer membrane protein (Porin) n=1 Tax=Cupriavidus basilensis TaxID=68895 RepID=A0A0C4YB70_9BURK|nr:Outer membrane protein (porin) [Cupriavidus basilensis]
MAAAGSAWLLLRNTILSGGVAALGLCVSGAAGAQSSVTLYGVMDVGLNYRSVAGADPATGKAAGSLALASGNELTSRWGLLGLEDIGGGYKVTFKVESGFSADTGAGNFSVPFPNDTNSLFDRGAIVGLIGPWGSVRLGRNWSPFFDGISAGDATGYMNFGSLANATFQNASNLNPSLGLAGVASGANSAANGGLLYTWVNKSIKYMLPDNFYGFSGGLLYSLGGTPGSFSNKSTMSANLNWTNGALGIASGYFDAKDPTGQTNNPWLRAYTIGTTYTAGPLKAGINFVKFRNPTTGANQNFYYVGAAYQASPAWRFTADWLHLQDLQNSSAGANLYKVGAGYALSKRTMLYTDVAFSDNKPKGMLGAGSNTSILTSPATIGRNQWAVGSGIRTVF